MKRAVLTPMHEKFVAEYLVDFNATAAYQRAGFKATGHGAEVNASLLLKKPHVQAAVAKGKAAQLAVVAMNAKEWDEHVATLARSAEKDSDRLTALKLVGTRLRLLTEQVEHSGEVRVINPYARPPGE